MKKPLSEALRDVESNLQEHTRVRLETYGGSAVKSLLDLYDSVKSEREERGKRTS